MQATGPCGKLGVGCPWPHEFTSSTSFSLVLHVRSTPRPMFVQKLRLPTCTHESSGSDPFGSMQSLYTLQVWLQ